MDRGQFDTLARLVSTKGSRRTAMATVLGATLLRLAPNPAAAKRKARAKTRGERRCYRGRRCDPGPGADASGCDFSGSTAWHQGDFRGANLSNSNFTGAQLGEADFRGANLSRACLVGANLLEAKLGASVNLHRAVFCRTRMPDGSMNDRDCGGGTRCCPTPAICEEDQTDECVGDVPCHLNRIDDLCTANWIPIPNHCCPNLVCTPIFESPFDTTCQVPCKTDEDCRERFGGGTTCQTDGQMCFYLPDWKCCR